MKKCYLIATLAVFLLSFSSVQEVFGERVYLPQTGQTERYVSGDDGDIRAGVKWPIPRFIDNGDDTITDTLTGLMWLKNGNCIASSYPSFDTFGIPGDGKVKWKDAVRFLAGMDSGTYPECGGGYQDWRLPNTLELETLINSGSAEQTIWLNGEGFDDIKAGMYWSSTTSAAGGLKVWSLDFMAGVTKVTGKASLNYVLPVRGTTSPPARVWKTGQAKCYSGAGRAVSCSGTGQDGEKQAGVEWPSPRFTATDQCVTDNLTGLMWQKKPSRTPNKWEKALTYAQGLNLCGYSDWRLPNQKELRSLLNYGKGGQAGWLLSQGFKGIKAANYWTGTTSAANGSRAWVVSLQNGTGKTISKNSSSYTLGVRGISTPFAPSAIPSAVPSKGLAPLDVSFSCTATDKDGTLALYEWDFEGDGIYDWSNSTSCSTNYVYSTAGIYKATLKVTDSDGVSTTSKIEVTAGSAANSLTIGTEGGSLSLGQFDLAIPSGLLPESIEIDVLELPSLADEAALQLDPLRFHPIGSAYQFYASFLSNEALKLTLSYQDSDIPDGYQTSNLAVLLRLPQVYPEGNAPEGGVLFVPLPSQVDELGHRVQVDIFGSGTLQLVAMAEPLDILSTTPVSATLPEMISIKGVAQLPSMPSFSVIFLEGPAGWTQAEKDQYKNDVLSSLNDSYAKLGLEMGFPAPLAPVTVYVKKIDIPIDSINVFAAVSPHNPLYIELDPFRTSDWLNTQILSLLAHEYFHVIQFWNSNADKVGIQVINDNRWFFEGTADWARDEVIDALIGAYKAPTGQRFFQPLNTNATISFEEPYQTIAFWKWLEAKSSGSIRSIIEHHCSLTHISTTPSLNNKNSFPARFLDSLVYVHPDLDFLQFVTDSLYWKNYDTNETNVGDLWDANMLGKPDGKDVPVDLRSPDHVFQLKKGAPGDGKANSLEIPYLVYSHLAADVFIIQNGEGEEQLQGTLHIEFEVPEDPEAAKFVASVISRDFDTEKRVEDLSAKQEVTFGFGNGSEVVVMIADPQWKAPFQPDPFAEGTVKVWVEPCGGQTNGVVIKVSSESQMINALKNAKPGDTVRLAPGTYHPLRQTFHMPPDPYGPFDLDAALIIWKGITLAGSGSDKTTLVLQTTGPSEPSADIWFLEGATLKDIRVVARNNSLYAGMLYPVEESKHRVSLCDVVVDFNLAPGYYGFYLEPWWEGGKYFFEMSNATLTCLGCDVYNRYTITGIGVSTSEDSQLVEVQIRDSNVSGWTEGLYYDTFPGWGLTLIDVDCASFSNNVYNVYECTGTYCIDHCQTEP
jgi:PKD repeat protein